MNVATFEICMFTPCLITVFIPGILCSGTQDTVGCKQGHRLSHL